MNNPNNKWTVGLNRHFSKVAQMANKNVKNTTIYIHQGNANANLLRSNLTSIRKAVTKM